MKKISDRTAKARLLKLADFLENLPEKRFNFGTWGSARSLDEDPIKEPEFCGTTACALGWAATLPFAKKEGISLRFRVVADYGDEKYIDAEFYKNGRLITSYQAARSLFGLGDYSMDFVFVPGEVPGDADAKRVAANIRHLVSLRFS